MLGAATFISFNKYLLSLLKFTAASAIALSTLTCLLFFVAIVSRKIAIPGFATWWADNTTDYDADFVGWIESLRE